MQAMQSELLKDIEQACGNGPRIALKRLFVNTSELCAITSGNKSKKINTKLLKTLFTRIN
jgi:hypothetical protein